MQLIKKIAVVLCFLGITFFILSGFVINESDPSLKISTKGYEYNGKIFTGVVLQKYSLLQPARVFVLYNGKQHGPDIQWYPNGTRFIERHYRNGQEVGEHKAWFENGSVQFYKKFIDGNADGEFFIWHANGQLAQYILYNKGVELAAKSWTAGGRPFFNYVWSDGKTIGLKGDSFCSPKKK